MEKKGEKLKNTSKRTWIFVAVTLVVALVLLALVMSKKSKEDMDSSVAPRFTKQGELTFLHADEKPIITIDIEIADNEHKREIGMMGRSTMADNEGMLFILEEEQLASFWMKNCILPLDIIFVNKVGAIVTIQKNTTPFSEQGYNATSLTLFVVEVNAGFTDTYAIAVGDRILWKRTN